MNDLERQLLDVLADVQALRQTNEKLDLILASRGVQFQEVLVPTPVRAPLEAVVEEAEADGLEKEEKVPEELPEDVVPPHFGDGGLQASNDWLLEDEAVALHRDGLDSFPSFQVEASFPEEQSQEAELQLSEEFVAPTEEEMPDDQLELELDAVWDSFFPSQGGEESPKEAEAPELVPQLPEAVPLAAPLAEEAHAEEAKEAQLPQGKDVTAMSRRERIRLLEREEALLSACDAQLEAERAPPVSDEGQEDCAQQALAAHHALQQQLGADTEPAPEGRGVARRERIAQLERGVAGETFVEAETESTERSDAQWLDSRRQERKNRLRQKARGEHPSALSPDVEINTVLPEDAVEGLGGDRADAACKCLARQAHRLSTEQLVRAVELLLQRGINSELTRAAAESILGNLAAVMGSLGLEALVNCLKLMALTEQQEQTTLDMLLAQLLVLSRRDSSSLTCPVLSQLGGALGALHGQLSARRGASGSNCAANRRCLEMLLQMITRQLSEFTACDLATLGPSFILHYLDDPLRRLVIRQAAALQAGLAEEGPTREAMLRLEEAVRTHSFAFVASLPDDSKDYLMKLKMIRQEASARAVLSTPLPPEL